MSDGGTFDFTLPQYLERPRAGVRTYGTLRLERSPRGDLWVLEGEPPVVIMAKRLFPGSQGKGHGVAKFPANRRTFGDLVWLMQRWPLEVLESVRPEWERNYAEACAHVRRLAELERAPKRAAPAVAFRGELKRFQEEGLAWALANRRTLIADEMGLGKTVQAIAYLATAALWPALIVPPPHLVRHWEAKLDEFLRPADTEVPLLGAGCAGLRRHTIRGIRPYELPDADIYVIHYLLLQYWRHALRELRPAAVVFDEVQELRHGGTQKYSAASEIAQRAESVVGLSGTPIYNRGGEIWHVLNIIDYHCLGDWDSFTREWCAGYGSDVVEDPALLGDFLRREGLMLRRRKDDVLTELPPKRRIVESIEADSGIAAALMDEAAALARASGETKDVLERGRLVREAESTARRATGVAKVPAVAEFVRGLLEAGEPTLVFLHHHDVADALMERLKQYRPVLISGRQSAAEKWAAKEKFASGGTNLCLISLRAATGIDGLQGRARVVVFAELDWSPAVHAQAEDRAHRTGQRDSVLAYYLVSDYGTDPDMREALGLKVSQFLGLMGDRGETEEDKALAAQAAEQHVARIIEKLRAIGAGKAA